MGIKNKASKDKVRFDGWGRLLKGYGSRKLNKAEPAYHGTNVIFTDDMLAEIYENDGFSRRVVTCIPEDMVNKGFSVAGDPANITINELDKLNWTGVFFDALCLSRLMGGAAILMGISDGRRLDQPVSVNSIKGMDFLRVIPKNRMSFGQNDLDTNPASKFYGLPMYFTITDSVSSNPYKVHRDRLLLLPWVSTSVIKAGQNLGQAKFWGTSVIQYTAKQIANLSVFHDSLANLVQEAVVGKYKISNLTQMLAAGEETKIMNRLDIINEAKSVINGVILDADNNEDYQRDSLAFAGMNGVSDTMMILLSCVTEVPVTRLFGRSPSGLDASGESDLTIYYDMVSSYQKSMLTEPLKRLVFYVDKYKKGIYVEPTESLGKTVHNGNNGPSENRSKRPLTESDITIRWNPLYQMTEKEAADVYKSNADADKTYLDMGVLSEEEIRVNRFVGGYNQSLSVETADLPEDPKASETEEVVVEEEVKTEEEPTE